MLLVGREEQVRRLSSNCRAESFVVLTGDPGWYK